MKKMCLVLSFTLILFLLLSCNGINNDHLKADSRCDFDNPLECNIYNGSNLLHYNNGFLYFYNIFPNIPGGQPEGRTLMRLDIKTNLVYPVCSKPQCTHNDLSCVYYGIYPCLYLNNDHVIFTRMVLSLENGEMGVSNEVVNLINGEKLIRDSITASSGSIIMKMLFWKDFVYYLSDSSKSEEGISAFRWNLSKNTVEEMKSFSEPISSEDSEYDFLAFMLDNQIYYVWDHTLYSADPDFSNEKIIRKDFDVLEALTDGEHIYYGVQSDKREGIETFYMTDPDFRSITPLGITAETGRVHVTENWIYYVKYDEISIGKNRVPGYEGDEIILEGSEIWRCRHDGEGHELVFRFDGELANTRPLHEIIVGDDIYTLYSYWNDDDQDDVLRDGDQFVSFVGDNFIIMKIHIPTGEVSYLDGIPD